MRCNEVRIRASEYVDRMLDAEARDRVADHLAECAACEAHVEDLRSLVESLRAIPSPSAPADLFASTLVALDREAEPATSIVTHRHFRLKPRYSGSILEICRALLSDYEFKLIAYSLGLVLSFCLFAVVLASMRPLMSFSPFVSPSQETIWITSLESQVLGSPAVASVHSLPRIAADSALSQTTPIGSDVDGLLVIAEIGSDGRGSIVQVLSEPVNEQAIGRLAVAMNQPSAFKPAYAISGRPIPSRVVLFIERVDVIG